jgi:hypothetical protein
MIFLFLGAVMAYAAASTLVFFGFTCAFKFMFALVFFTPSAAHAVTAVGLFPHATELPQREAGLSSPVQECVEVIPSLPLCPNTLRYL